MTRKPNFKLNWKYALGEVFLIFIGISMAYGLQQFANNRSDHKRSKEYLKALLIELDENLNIIEDKVKGSERDIEWTTYYIEWTNSDSARLMTDQQITRMISELGPPYYSSTSQASFDDITNSGGFELINDAIIRRNMIRYGMFLTEYESIVEKPLNEWYNKLSPYFQQHADLSEMETSSSKLKVAKDLYSNDKEAFIQNRAFTNILRARIIWQSTVIAHVEREKEDITRFKQQLKTYIEQ